MATVPLRRIQKLLGHCQSKPSSEITANDTSISPNDNYNTLSVQSQGTRLFNVIDCHAAGEPARVIVGGLPHIPGDTVEEKRKYMMDHLDHIRLLLLQEPRGYPCQNANAIVPPSCGSPARFGFIIMEQNKIYPAMSGHNTICVATALLESGMVPMVPDANSLRDDGSFETTFHLEAPVGLIQIRAQCKGRKAVQITLTNTVSFMDPKYENISVRLPLPIRSILGSTKAMNEGTNGMNESVTVDIAFGGMWYVIVDMDELRGCRLELKPSRGTDIVRLGEVIKVAAKEQYPVNLNEYRLEGQRLMDYEGPDILVFREKANGHNVNAVVMSNGVLKWNAPETWTGMIDRSPCGTGTSAVMAMLHCKGELGVKERFVHRSIIGTEFVGVIEEESSGAVRREDDGQSLKSIIPTISGRGWITAHSQIVLDSTDPFPSGFTVNDIW